MTPSRTGSRVDRRDPRLLPRYSGVRGIAVALSVVVECLGPAPHAAAHPHVWITVGCEFAFDVEGRVAGLIQTWTFDEMYSVLAVMGIPRDRHGQRTSAALSALADTMVSSSSDKGYFTSASVGGRSIALSTPRDVQGVWGGDQKLAIRFRIDLGQPIRLDADPLRIEVRDTDFFADFKFDKAVQANGLPAGCAVRLARAEDALPSDPQEREEALINGPILMLTNGLVLTCSPPLSPNLRPN